MLGNAVCQLHQQILLPKAAGLGDHVAGASLIGEPRQHDTAFQLAYRLQLPCAHAVHALQQGVAAGEQQGAQMLAAEQRPEHLPDAAGNAHPQAVQIDAPGGGVVGGSALFVGCAIGKTPIERTSKNMLPLYAVMVTVLLLVTYIPEISLWLPRMTGYAG